MSTKVKLHGFYRNTSNGGMSVYWDGRHIGTCDFETVRRPDAMGEFFERLKLHKLFLTSAELTVTFIEFKTKTPLDHEEI